MKIIIVAGLILIANVCFAGSIYTCPSVKDVQAGKYNNFTHSGGTTTDNTAMQCFSFARIFYKADPDGDGMVPTGKMMCVYRGLIDKPLEKGYFEFDLSAGNDDTIYQTLKTPPWKQTGTYSDCGTQNECSDALNGKCSAMTR